MAGKKAGATAGERSINSVATLVRAEWILERWEERPSLLRKYGQIMKEVRARFECGKVAAEQAHKLALQLLRESGSNDTDRRDELAAMLESRYLEWMERAASEPGSAGALRAARIGDMLARLRGITIDRVEHSGAVDVSGSSKDYEDLTDEQLAALASLGDKKAPTTH